MHNIHVHYGQTDQLLLTFYACSYIYASVSEILTFDFGMAQYMQKFYKHLVENLEAYFSATRFTDLESF